MKKSSINSINNRNNSNNSKEGKIVINLDNKNITKNKEPKTNLAKKEFNIIKNINNQNKVKSANISKNKSLQQNLDYIPKIIFNLNTNKVQPNSVDNKQKTKSNQNRNQMRAIKTVKKIK